MTAWRLTLRFFAAIQFLQYAGSDVQVNGAESAEPCWYWPLKKCETSMPHCYGHERQGLTVPRFAP